MLSDFLNSIRQGLSKNTILFYQRCLGKAIGIEISPQGINGFLASLDCGNGKFAYYRAIRAFCNWMHKQGHLQDNPTEAIETPFVAKRILPAITEEQCRVLLHAAPTVRDKCIISLLFDSGLRLNEVCNILPSKIEWDMNILSVVVKGNKEAKAAFTQKTALLIREYLRSNGTSKTLFGLRPKSIQDMLKELSKKVGFPCNAHSFRRGFACHLHKKGLSTLSIMHLGRWSSLDMVAKYCRSITFDDCLGHYRKIE